MTQKTLEMLQMTLATTQKTLKMTELTLANSNHPTELSDHPSFEESTQITVPTIQMMASSGSAAKHAKETCAASQHDYSCDIITDDRITRVTLRSSVSHCCGIKQCQT